MAVVRIEDPERLDRVLAGTERPLPEEVVHVTGARSPSEALEAVRGAWTEDGQ
jgi:hypothetical protein